MKLYVMSVLLFMSSMVFASEGILEEGSLEKEREKINLLKKEFEDYYAKQEEKYKLKQEEIDKQLADIEREKEKIEELKKDNEQLLGEIKGEVSGKTTTVYNKMKSKTASKIFDKMMKDGKVDEVFDIIIRIKPKKVTAIFKTLDVEYASELTERLENYKPSNKEK